MSRRESKRNEYEVMRNEGIQWTSSQCATQVLISLCAIASLVMIIVCYGTILRTNNRLDQLFPALDLDLDHDKRSVEDEAHPPMILDENVVESGFIDVVEEERLRHNQMTRDARGPSRLSSNCIANWGIEYCASAMWWMCNNGEICTPNQICKAYSKNLIGQIKTLSSAYVKPSDDESEANRINIALAASQLCIKDNTDPACGVAVVYVCSQPSIHLMCTELVKILQANYYNGLIQ